MPPIASEELKKSFTKTVIKFSGAVAVIIFSIEAFIMLYLADFNLSKEVIKEGLLDASLLTLFCTPLIYNFVVKPFVARTRKAERKLQEALALKNIKNNQLLSTLSQLDIRKRVLDQHVFVVESDDKNTILYVNDAVCRATLYSREDLVGRSQSILSSGLHNNDTWVEMHDVVMAGNIWQKELCDRRKDGTLYWVFTTVAATYNENQQFSGYITISTDITENKRREEILEATHKDLIEAKARAEQASIAKSQFLSNMSHEIRTPMNGVFGMTDLLSRTKLDEQQRRLVGTIQDSAKSLLTIINDILDLSRIEAGKLELDCHDFNLRDGLERTVELFATPAHSKGLELSVYISEDVPVFVSGDAGRIKQICTNLIGNALKFTKYGDVSLRVTRAGGGAGTSQLKFEVKDTGIGIDPVMCGRLFQPFTQAETSTSRRFGGTGLGLSITRHLVDLMGGTIGIQSDLGKGTTVTFTLDLAHGESDGSDCKPDYSALVGARILVIDDSETNRDVITNYLEHCQANVTAVETTELAWKLLLAAADQGRPFHAAVVDMLMPNENGLEFAARVKANPVLARLKIILATSISWDGDLAAVRAAGIEAVFTKPIRRHSLIDEISRVVAGVRHQGWRSKDQTIVSNFTKQNSTRVQQTFSARVLLAEDNPVNIEVAKAYLQNLGCTVCVAVNGLQAAAFVEHDHYDIILMDCQMPVMDGLEATRRIRTMEVATNKTRTPIVAVTANAFNDDKIQCLDAGMDDHLGKPFSEDQLAQVFTKWLKPKQSVKEPGDSSVKSSVTNSLKKRAPKPTQSDRKVSKKQAKPAAPSCLNTAMLHQMQQSHPELFSRMIETFKNYAPEMEAQLISASTDSKRESLRMAAHSLKSSSANVGATKVTELCRTLENLIRSNPDANSVVCDTFVVDIRRELNAAVHELSAMVTPQTNTASSDGVKKKRVRNSG